MRSSKKRKESSAEKIFAPSAADRLLQFCLKTLIPLIPLTAIFIVSSLVINAEISGRYSGSSPSGGAVVLDIQEDNESLSGSVLLGRKRYQIVEGKMLNENQMEMKLEKLSSESVLGLSAEKSYKFKSANDGLPEGNQPLPELSGEKTEKKEVLTLKASKDQNELNGDIMGAEKSYKFSASRSVFTAFFGRRWLNRCLSYVGIRI